MATSVTSVTSATKNAENILASNVPRALRLSSQIRTLLENDEDLHELVMTLWVKVVLGSKAEVENFVWVNKVMDKGQDSTDYWSTVKAGYKSGASDNTDDTDDDTDDDADFCNDTTEIVNGRETQKLVEKQKKNTYTNNGMKAKKHIKDLLRVYLKSDRHTRLGQKHRYFNSLTKALIGLIVFARRQNDDRDRQMIIYQSVIVVSGIVDNATKEINHDTHKALKERVAALEGINRTLYNESKENEKEHQKQKEVSAQELNKCKEEKTTLKKKLDEIRTILNSNHKEDDSKRLARIRRKIEEETNNNPVKRKKLSHNNPYYAKLQ